MTESTTRTAVRFMSGSCENDKARERQLSCISPEIRERLVLFDRDIIDTYIQLRSHPGCGTVELGKLTGIARRRLDSVLAEMTREGFVEFTAGANGRSFQVTGWKAGRLCKGCAVWRALGKADITQDSGKAVIRVEWPEYIVNEMSEKAEAQGVSLDVWIARTLLREMAR